MKKLLFIFLLTLVTLPTLSFAQEEKTEPMMTDDMPAMMPEDTNMMHGGDMPDMMRMMQGGNMSGTDMEGMGEMMGMMSMMHNNSMMGGCMLNWAIVLFALVFLILGIVFLVRRSGSETNQRQDTDDALDILKKRYAKGDIDEQEFTKIKNQL